MKWLTFDLILFTVGISGIYDLTIMNYYEQKEYNMAKKSNDIEITGIASIIGSVKKELEIAHLNYLKEPKKPVVRINTMKIELSVIAEQSQTVDGAFNLKIVSIGGEKNISNQLVHKIILDFDVEGDETTKYLER